MMVDPENGSTLGQKKPPPPPPEEYLKKPPPPSPEDYLKTGEGFAGDWRSRQQNVMGASGVTPNISALASGAPVDPFAPDTKIDKSLLSYFGRDKITPEEDIPTDLEQREGDVDENGQPILMDWQKGVLEKVEREYTSRAPSPTSKMKAYESASKQLKERYKNGEISLEQFQQQADAVIDELGLDRDGDRIYVPQNEIEYYEELVGRQYRQALKEQAIKERDPFIHSVFNALSRGSAGVLNSPVRYAAAVEETGRAVLNLVRSDDEKKGPGYWQLRSELENRILSDMREADKRYESSITEALSSGNISDAAGQTIITMAETLPHMSMLIVGNFAGAKNLTYGWMGSDAGLNQYIENKKDPSMTPFVRVLNAMGHALSEPMFESVGTMAILDGVKHTIRKQGVNTVREQFIRANTDYYTRFIKGMNQGIMDGGRGMASEMGTETTNILMDMASGKSVENPMSQIADAGIVGFFMDAGVGSSALVASKGGSAKYMKHIKKYIPKGVDFDTQLDIAELMIRSDQVSMDMKDAPTAMKPMLKKEAEDISRRLEDIISKEVGKVQPVDTDTGTTGDQSYPDLAKAGDMLSEEAAQEVVGTETTQTQDTEARVRELMDEYNSTETTPERKQEIGETFANEYMEDSTVSPEDKSRMAKEKLESGEFAELQNLMSRPADNIAEIPKPTESLSENRSSLRSVNERLKIKSQELQDANTEADKLLIGNEVNELRAAKRKLERKIEKQDVIQRPTGFERTSENLKAMAERVRKAKGMMDPESGTLQARIPYIEKGWDGAVEVMAKSLEGGAQFVEAIERAVEYIRNTDVYKSLTRSQQMEAEQGLRDALGKYTDQQIAELTEVQGKAKEYTENIDRLKQENPEEYWSVDRPTDEQVAEAAEQGRLIEVRGGSGIVTPDGEIIGLIKTDPAARGVAKAVLDQAVKMGGNKLNAFSGYLTDLYAKSGFVTVAKVPFDPKHAPKDAPKENLPKFVEYMVLDSGNRIPKEVLGKEFTNPTEAMDHWNRVATKMKTGEMFNEFFTDVSAGTKGFSNVEYTPVLKLDEEAHGEFVKNYEPHRGNFDAHISKSIPGHKEIQVVSGKAVVDALPKGGRVLDIGGSENSWAKGITETSGGKIKTTTVDPNTKMKQHSEKTPVEGNEYIDAPFMTGWEGRPAWQPTDKFDAVHESMTFQFISNERGKQLDYIIDGVLKEDGLLLMEQKFVPGESKESKDIWEKNEAQKDKFKEKYFEKEELTQKKTEVIEGMHERMVPSETFEKMLSDRFKHVYRYWDSGNFKGYAASNSMSKIEAFRKSVGEAGQSNFTSEPIGYVKGKPKVKTTAQKKIDSQLQRKRNKILVDEYAALKDQIRTQEKIAKDIDKGVKEAQKMTESERKQREKEIAVKAKEVKQAFNDFISGQAWQGTMNKRASKAIWRRINNMDFTKPGTISEAQAYIEKAVNDANFRAELAEWEATYTTLEKVSDPRNLVTKSAAGVEKGKSVSVEAQRKIKDLRKRMEENDPVRAQEEIDSILDKAASEDRYLTLEEFNRIEDLSFDGLLRNHPADLNYLQARVQDLKDIAKRGRTQQRAKMMMAQEAKAQRRSMTLNILTKFGKKPVNMEADYQQAYKLNKSAYDKVARSFDWVQQDSWHTLMDKLSRYDKDSDPMKGYMNEEFSGMAIRAEEMKYVSTEETMSKINDKLEKIYGKSGKKLRKQLEKNSSEKIEINWEGAKKPLRWTQGQVYKRWMELQDPSLVPSLTKQGYFDEVGAPTKKYEAIEKALTKESREWAEYQLNELYPWLYDKYNPMYVEMFYTDMPKNDKYSPISIAGHELKGEAMVDHMVNSTTIRNIVSNNHMKARVDHAKEILPVDGDMALLNYIAAMEHFNAYAKPVRDMTAVFKDPEVRLAIENNFGKGYNEIINFFIDKYADKYRPDNMKLERELTKWRGRFTVGSLALKPAIAVKQLTSIPAYWDVLTPGEFSAGVMDYIKNYKTAVETLNNIPYMRERYSKGWDRDVMVAMKKDAEALLSKGGQSSIADFWMFQVKWGDKAAIHVGGWPVYKKAYDNAIKNNLDEASARRDAEKAFVDATRSSQQATGLSDLSYVQSSHPMYKWLTMYKTSPLQYHRKVAEGLRGIRYGRGNKWTNAKKMFIYHALLPSIFQLVSNGFKWEGEDQLRAVILGNANGLFIAGDIAAHIADKIQGKPFGYSLTPLESIVPDMLKTPAEIQELWYLMRNPELITVDEFFEATKHLSSIVSALTGTGVAGIHNTLSGIADAIYGNTEYPARRILGWSENALEGGTDLLDPQLYEGMLEMMNDDKVPVVDIRDNFNKRKGSKPPPPPPGN